MADWYNRQYDSDWQFALVFDTFVVLAICIAALGLFGLASFTIVQRTREVGIRKVLGSSGNRFGCCFSSIF